MKKIFSMLVVVFALCLTVQNVFAANVQKLKPKAPVLSEEMKPIVVKYRNQNYVGAAQDIEELLEKKDDVYARYYLALCYTQLGISDKARAAYQEVVDNQSSLTLSYYSRRALECLDDPRAEACISDKKKVENDSVEQANIDDMSAFIESGKKIHPSVMDRIITDRLERQLEEQEYIQKQQEKNENLKSQAPTNEEIASALNTLSKIGFNPFQNMYNQNQMFGQIGYNPATMLNSNADMAKMMMYSQLSNQMNLPFGNLQDNFINNYGI